MKSTPTKKGDPFLVAFGIYGGVGIQLAASVVGGLLLGHWVDQHLGTGPWLAVSGLVLGSIGGFYNLIRILNWQQKRRNQKGHSWKAKP